VFAALVFVACSSRPPPVEPSTPGAESPPDPQEVRLLTQDSVTLVADYYGVASDPGPAFALFHMIPPGNDRSNWPRRFVEALRDEGWGVRAVDRRGAGDSEGVPREAYEGDKGRLDVAASFGWLGDMGHDPIVLIGASNGTTSVLDYVVEASPRSRPAAVGFMTGGGYTENQTRLADLPPIPAVFTYSTAEAAWSEAQKEHDPGTWAFLEYPGGGHGTRMFDDKPRVTRDLVEFFRPVLAE